MKFYPKAKVNIKEGLDNLTKLEPGGVVHFCLVRVGGPDDKDARVVFGERASGATKEKFIRVWSDEPEVTGSDRTKWFVVRGAFTMGDKGVTTLPAIRGNRVVAAAEMKTQLKGLRDSLTGCGVPVTPLKKAISGAVGRATDTAKLDHLGGPDGDADDVDDVSDMKGDKGAKSDKVADLVARFKKVGLRVAVAKMASADDEREKTAAREALVKVRDALVKMQDEGKELDRTLRAKTLGSTRFKESLNTLDELDTRARAAIHAAEKALGQTVDGADLSPTARPGADDILVGLRADVTRLNAAPEGEKLPILADLYFTADTWLKAAGEGSTKRKRSETVDLAMKDKVLDLFKKVVDQLSKRAGVPINSLPAWLEQRYGKGMTAHGFEIDIEHQSANWLSRDQAEVFRIHVKGGQLHQYDWWDWPVEEAWDSAGRTDLSTKKLVPVNSASSENAAVIQAGYSGFVMSMGGDLYMTRHASAAQKTRLGVYHSSYMAGLPVLMAGEILVKNGAVKRVNTGSGHYQPSMPMVVRFLKQMRTLGVTVEEVADYANKNVKSVEEFLRDNAGREPSPDEYAANEVATAKIQQKLFFAELFEANRARIKLATSNVDALAKAKAELAKNTKDQAEGSDKLAAKAKSESRAKTFAKTQGVKLVQKDLEDLRALLGELTARLAKRDEDNVALKAKDKDPKADKADGWVVELKKVIEEVKAAIEIVRVALAAA